MELNIKGSSDLHTIRRQSSPTTAFLDQIPLDHTQDTASGTFIMQDHSELSHDGPAQNDMFSPFRDMRDHNYPTTSSSRILKRSAPTEGNPVLYDQPFKRQREEYVNGSSFSQPVPKFLADTPATSSVNGDERQDYDMLHNLQQQLRGKIQSGKSNEVVSTMSPATTRGQYRASTQIIYTNASTQTDHVQINSSKLALVQEELAIAQLRHEAEIARRKESLALELGYERQVLELRHKFEVPTKKRSTEPSPATNGSLFMTPLNTSTVLQPADRSSIRASTQDLEPRQVELRPQAIETPPKSAPIVREPARTQPDAQLNSVGNNPSSIPAAREQPKPQASTRDQSTTIKPPPAPTTREPTKPVATNGTPNTNTKSSIPPAKRPTAPSGPKEQEHARDVYTDRRIDRPSAPAHNRRRSSSGTSVNIITSRSPAAVRRDEPRAYREPSPPLKRLTCYFWKNGGCTKGQGECAYAHYETGVIATNPLQLRKDARRRGRW
ncbi:MAG: hypothetical protein Q9222_007452 [Ikaeria aurantiellina]